LFPQAILPVNVALQDSDYSIPAIMAHRQMRIGMDCEVEPCIGAELYLVSD
jgi:hypothetical protein